MQADRLMLLVLILLGGGTVGSFLTVVASRVPAGQSIVRPRSSCPQCHSQLLNRDLIPVVSWCLLRGRCRRCKTPIPALYPLLELLAATSWGLAFLLFGLTPSFLLAGSIASLTVVSALIDAKQKAIPGKILAVGFLITAPVSWFGHVTPWPAALLGLLLCSAFLLLARHFTAGRVSWAHVQLGALLGIGLGWLWAMLALLFFWACRTAWRWLLKPSDVKQQISPGA